MDARFAVLAFLLALPVAVFLLVEGRRSAWTWSVAALCAGMFAACLVFMR